MPITPRLENMPDFLTVKQAAKVMQLSTDHVYNLAATGRMLAIKISTKCIRIPRVGLQKWLEGEFTSQEGATFGNEFGNGLEGKPGS